MQKTGGAKESSVETNLQRGDKGNHTAAEMKTAICIVMGGAILLTSGCTKITIPVFVPPKSQADLPNNKPQLIRQELLDPNLVVLVGKAIGLSDGTIAGFRVVQGQNSNDVELEHVGILHGATVIMSHQLEAYVMGREQGHTKEFILSSFTNRTNVSAISDPDLCVLLQNEPAIPASWLKRSQTGTFTNKAGQTAWRKTTYLKENGVTRTNETVHIPKMDEVCRWTSYTLTDGDVAWRYVITFNADASLRDINCERMDAKELDPKYADIIKAVEVEVEAEMEKQCIRGRFGSVHTFWRLKKEKLKARGIEWLSPSELNRNVSYD
ncbi:MAG: hypothetical protein ABSH11_05350 [Verrucomicrobiota bacterium]